MMQIEELALKVADELNEMKHKGKSFAARDAVIDDYAIRFATRFIAAYAAQQEPVAEVVDAGGIAHFPKLQWKSANVSLETPFGTLLYAAPVVPADTVRLNYIEENFHVLGFTQGSRDWFCEYVDDNRRADNLRDMIDLMVTAGEVKL